MSLIFDTQDECDSAVRANEDEFIVKFVSYHIDKTYVNQGTDPVIKQLIVYI